MNYSTTPGKSPRHASRFLAGLQAVLHLEDGDHGCQAFDLSRSGVLVRGNPPLTLGEDIRLTLLSGTGDLVLELTARVIRVAPDGDAGETPAGLEFAEIHEANRPTLEALISRVIEGVAPAALESLSGDSSPVEIRRALETISLGHRIALATRAMPAERQLLIHDPQIQVIDALARNPNLLPHEVRTILRMPGLLPHTLEAMSRDSKWKADEQIKILLATHSNAPLALAERLVASLSPLGVQAVLRSSGLKPALRAKLVKKGNRR